MSDTTLESRQAIARTRGWTFFVTESLSGTAGLEGQAPMHTAEALIEVEDREWAASVTEASLERLLDRVDEIDRENGRL